MRAEQANLIFRRLVCIQDHSAIGIKLNEILYGLWDEGDSGMSVFKSDGQELGTFNIPPNSNYFRKYQKAPDCPGTYQFDLNSSSFKATKESPMKKSYLRNQHEDLVHNSLTISKRRTKKKPWAYEFTAAHQDCVDASEWEVSRDKPLAVLIITRDDGTTETLYNIHESIVIKAAHLSMREPTIKDDVSDVERLRQWVRDVKEAKWNTDGINAPVKVYYPNC